MSDNNGNNTVTNVQESFFRAVTTTSVKIEAVNPVNEKKATPAKVAPEPKVKEETEAPAKVTPEPKAKEETEAPTKVPPKKNYLLEILLGLILLGVVVVIGLLLGGKLGTLPGSTANAPAGNSSAANAPTSGSLVTQDWNAVLTSANSNGNFIGDFGGRGNGSVIPTEAIDLSGKTWPVGRALLTYCETASNCLYMFANPGEVMPRAFNVNLYTPQFTGDLAKELQYVNTGWNNNADVTWTYWTNN